MDSFKIQCKKCTSQEIKIESDKHGISLECQACGEWEWYEKNTKQEKSRTFKLPQKFSFSK